MTSRTCWTSFRSLFSTTQHVNLYLDLTILFQFSHYFLSSSPQIHNKGLMFRLILTLGYLLPNIYVFFRIKALFISKGYKLWYIFVYLAIALIYPIFGSSFQPDANFIVRMLSVISDYMLPLYLYLFLILLCFDLFLLLNLVLKILPVEKRKSFLFRFYTLLAVIFLSVSIVVGGIINLNTIRISEYSITVPRKNSNIDHLKVVFVADFHLQQNFPQKFVDQYVKKVNALQPDLMLYGGDIVEGFRTNGSLEKFESILVSIHSKYGSYGVLGNHDSFGRRGQGSFFRNSGITLLRDSLVRIDSSFILAGRIDQQRGRKSVNEILGNTSLDLPILLLDHRPTELEETSQTPVDVQFSGHTHNGQLFPLNYILRTMYELTWGYKKIRNTHFFVTSGLRLWGPPVKTAGKSEIMLIKISFQ